MLTVEKVTLLAGTEVFARVPTAVLADVAGVAVERTYAAGEWVMTEGEAGGALLVVADGDTTLGLRGRGSVIGELALLDPAPRSASVTAIEDSLVLVISKDDFDIVMTDNPELSEGVIRYLVRFIRAETVRAAGD